MQKIRDNKVYKLINAAKKFSEVKNKTNTEKCYLVMH